MTRPTPEQVAENLEQFHRGWTRNERGEVIATECKCTWRNLSGGVFGRQNAGHWDVRGCPEHSNTFRKVGTP